MGEVTPKVRTQATRSRGVTLVELLIVIIVIAVLAAIALPKFVNSSERSKESSLHGDLKLVRDAVARYQGDTGLSPAMLFDLAANVAPIQGKNSSGTSTPLPAGTWNGPYLAALPTDPVSGASFTYSTTSPTVGQVSSSAAGNDSNGVAFSTY